MPAIAAVTIRCDYIGCRNEANGGLILSVGLDPTTDACAEIATIIGVQLVDGWTRSIHGVLCPGHSEVIEEAEIPTAEVAEIEIVEAEVNIETPDEPDEVEDEEDDDEENDDEEDGDEEYEDEEDGDGEEDEEDEDEEADD